MKTRTILTLCFCNAVNCAIDGSIVPLTILLKDQFGGGNEIWIPLLVTGSRLGNVIGLPLFGWFADIFGYKLAAYAVLLINILCSALCCFVESLPVIVVLRFLLGCSAFSLIGNNWINRNSLNQEAARWWLAWYGLTNGFGIICGIVVSGIIALLEPYIIWKTVNAFWVLVSLLCAIMLWKFAENPKRNNRDEARTKKTSTLPKVKDDDKVQTNKGSLSMFKAGNCTSFHSSTTLNAEFSSPAVQIDDDQVQTSRGSASIFTAGENIQSASFRSNSTVNDECTLPTVQIDDDTVCSTRPLGPKPVHVAVQTTPTKRGFLYTMQQVVHHFSLQFCFGLSVGYLFTVVLVYLSEPPLNFQPYEVSIMFVVTFVAMICFIAFVYKPLLRKFGIYNALVLLGLFVAFLDICLQVLFAVETANLVKTIMILSCFLFHGVLSSAMDTMNRTILIEKLPEALEGRIMGVFLSFRQVAMIVGSFMSLPLYRRTHYLPFTVRFFLTLSALLWVYYRKEDKNFTGKCSTPEVINEIEIPGATSCSGLSTPSDKKKIDGSKVSS
mmetsp:Transcript_16272/g.28063  ORF Transcript_16272/g.28063 Transcript_16272/m.28063 type:complete len:553 (+) Transcript_16272:910-2568(+)